LKVVTNEVDRMSDGRLFHAVGKGDAKCPVAVEMDLASWIE